MNLAEQYENHPHAWNAYMGITNKLISFISGKYGVQVDSLAVISHYSFLRAWVYTFCIDANNFFVLNPHLSKLIKTKEKDLKESLLNYLVETFLNLDIVDTVVKNSKEEVDRNQLSSELNKLANAEFINQVKYNRQFKSIKVEVDIFSEWVSTVDNGHQLTIQLKQPDIVPTMELDETERVSIDFIRHFPEFNSFIELAVASRFAADRRECFLWLHAPSSWGKGMLMSAFKELGWVYEVTVKEIEAAMEGKPVGLDSLQLAYSSILWVDEFKSVKGELKQLNNTLMLAAKYELKTEVNVYLKMFTSAELVPSLAGENGVEDQFAKRFSYLRGDGQLDDSLVLQSVGKGAYLRALSAYIAHRLNDLIDQYRKMGRDKAELEADKFIKRWRMHHSITDVYGHLDDSIKSLAHDFRKVVYEMGKEMIAGNNIARIFPENQVRIHQEIKSHITIGYYGPEREQVIVLSSPSKVIKDWIPTVVDRSELGTVTHKTSILLQLASDIDDPQQNHRIYSSLSDTKGESKKGLIVFVRKRPAVAEVTEDAAVSFM